MTASSTAQAIRAHGLINMRIRRGQMKRRRRCEDCWRIRKCDAHHPDYRKPEVVVFVCRSCHMKRHQAMKVRAA